MSTIVLPNLPEETTQNMETTQTTEAVEATPVTGVKRSLGADATTPAAIKQQKTVVPRFNPDYYNYKTRSPNVLSKTDPKDGKMTVRLVDNSMKYDYKIMAPPGYCKYIKLGEGGNIGQFNWCATEKSATIGLIYTNKQSPMKSGESTEEYQKRCSKMVSQQQTFIDFLKATHQKAFDGIWDNVTDIKSSYVKKATAVLPKDSAPEKIEATARRLFDKFCSSHTPIKEDGTGGIEFQIKCSAFQDNKNGSYTPRTVNVYDGCSMRYPPHPTISGKDIKDGAYIAPVFAIRVYQTPGNASFGITYQLVNRHVILMKNGDGRLKDGPMTDEQLKTRQYQFKGVTSKSGNYNIYINDLSGGKYIHRTPAAITKYIDLTNGTLGKFPGVTTSNAKFTATLMEDASNKEYFDHVEQLVQDAGTFLFNDKNIMPDIKADHLNTAKELSADTEQSVEDTALSLFMNNVQSPVKQTGEMRELRVSCKMFKYKDSPDDEDVKNTFKYQDEDLNTMDNDPDLQPGSKVSMVLEPVIYVLASGVIHVCLKIDLDNPIRVLAGGSSIEEDGDAMPMWTADMF